MGDPAENPGGMTKFGTRKFNVHLREVDRDNLAALRAMMSPRNPALINESDVIRYCIQQTRDREVGRSKDGGG